MNFGHMLKTALQAILRSKVRSALTCLGLVVGIASVIAVQGIGRGSGEMMYAEFAKLGHNYIIITPDEIALNGVRGGGQGERLTVDDGEAIRRELGHLVKASTPIINGRCQLVRENRNWNARVLGVSDEYPVVRNMTTCEGRFFGRDEQRRCQRVCVIGATVRDRLFGPDAESLGRALRIGDATFRVVGVLTPHGSSTFGTDQDDAVFVPYTTNLRVLERPSSVLRSVDSIQISLWHPELLDEARSAITGLLRRRHSLRATARNDFIVRDNREAYALVSRVYLGVMVLLTVFAGLSLFIGGVGIMNIMLVSVAERTNEIGLLAAIGARPRVILGQFVIEALMLAAAGGVIGIPVGAGLTALLCRVLRWPVFFDVGAIVVAFAFTLFVGLAFGYFPARRAARLDPVECLRYE